MDAVLVALTIVSVITALAAGWFAWRLRDEDQRRSAARVAALSTAIDAVDSRGPHAPVAVNELFASEQSPVAHGTPVIKVAVGVAMALILIIAVAMTNRGGSNTSESPASGAVAAARRSAPLELISMRHEREGDTLKVSGLVRNPRGGSSMTRVTAVVFAFNRAGAFVTSGRAALDFTTLDPGDESPFVVSIPGVADVGRYRVSFRTEAGAVQHVDRRAEQMRLTAAARY